MNILAIETSCDETAICLLQATETPDGISFAILGNMTHSQVDVHREYGGVFPALAKREHQKNLPIVLEQVLKQSRANSSPSQGEVAGDGIEPDGGVPSIDYICVTSGPGLEPALWTGIVFAQELAKKWSVPVVPVNHMEGHILSVLVPHLLAGEGSGVRFDVAHNFSFPALALLISGGHTELVRVTAIGDYAIIGKTLDDAVGEAFDKVARMMDLPYPGGPEISKLAEAARANTPSGRGGDVRSTTGGVSEKTPHPNPLLKGEGTAPTFPRPMVHSKDFDFSFSGLKTAVLYYIKKLGTLTDNDKQAVACEFENAVAETLVSKAKRAITETGAQTLIIAGGVSANRHIISEMKNMVAKEFPEIKLLVPSRELTGDNATMIALAGYFKVQKNPNADYGEIRAEGNLRL